MLSVLVGATKIGEAFSYIGYILVSLLALMVMIVVHELGHYTAGKLLGFKVDEFGIGFGPAIFRHKNKKNGEMFTIRPFPLGGFCAFHGEDAEGALLDEKGNKVLDSKGVVLKDPFAFNNQKAWKRLIVLFAGAFMNFVSAIVIITIYFSAYGQVLPTVVGTYTNPSTSKSVFVDGDVLLSVNGKQINIVSQEDMESIFSNLGDSAKFKVLRGNKTVKFTANKFYYYPFKDGDVITKIGDKEVDNVPCTELASLSEADTDEPISLTLLRKNDSGELKIECTMLVKRGVVQDDLSGYYSYGFGVTRSTSRAKLPFFLAFGRAFGFCFFIVFKILASLGGLITGKVSIKAMGGTITTIGTMATVSSYGFDSFLYVVAVISANLAVMNLLPFPALDGSKMLFTLIEMIFKKPVPRKIEAVIHTVGLVLLVVFAVFLDIFHLVRR